VIKFPLSDHLSSGQESTHQLNQHDPLALIGLPTLRSVIYVHVSEILYCKGESSQTSVFFMGNKSLIVTRTLRQCEELLGNFGFCRIHKSYLINLYHLKAYHRVEGKAVDLTDGTRIEISATYKDVLKDKLFIL